ncbi:MAG: hypothetical protein HXX81_06840 [Campylobacterales bacterium]|nr:hypothetical protein [Campylobacterales bacterium]
MSKKSFSFTVSIVLLFSTLLILTSFTIMTYNYITTSKQSFAMIDKNNEEIRKSLIQNTVNYFNKIMSDVKILAQSGFQNNFILNHEPISNMMWEQVNSNSGISSIFLANNVGNFCK